MLAALSLTTQTTFSSISQACKRDNIAEEIYLHQCVIHQTATKSASHPFSPYWHKQRCGLSSLEKSGDSWYLSIYLLLS